MDRLTRFYKTGELSGIVPDCFEPKPLSSVESLIDEVDNLIAVNVSRAVFQRQIVRMDRKILYNRLKGLAFLQSWTYRPRNVQAFSLSQGSAGIPHH